VSDQNGLEVYEVEEAARLAKETPPTIRVWARTGRIKAFRFPGSRKWKIVAPDFDRMLRGEDAA
jgi:predicted site-specific integrase-resolvase